MKLLKLLPAVLILVLLVGCGGYDTGDAVTLPELGIDQARVVTTQRYNAGGYNKTRYTVQFMSEYPPNDAEEIATGVYLMTVEEGQLACATTSNVERAQEVAGQLATIRRNQPETTVCDASDDDERDSGERSEEERNASERRNITESDIGELIRAELARQQGIEETAEEVEAVAEAAEESIETIQVTVDSVSTTLSAERTFYRILLRLPSGEEMVILTPSQEVGELFGETGTLAFDVLTQEEQRLAIDPSNR